MYAYDCTFIASVIISFLDVGDGFEKYISLCHEKGVLKKGKIGSVPILAS